MKIAYILAQYAATTERFIEREIEGLAHKGVEIHVFALRRGATSGHGPVPPRYRRQLWHPAGVTALFHWAVHRPGVFFGLIADTITTYARFPRDCASVLRNLVAAADFAHQAALDGLEHIHAHFAYVPADVGRMMSKLLNIPFTVSVHAWDIYAQPVPLIAPRLRDATAIVACTEEGRQCVQRVLPADTPTRLHLVRHGLPPASFDPGARPEGVILGIGRLVEKKGFDILLAACGALRNRGVEFEAAIIGDGPLREKLETMASALQLRDAVTFTGELPWRAVHNYLRRATVLVAPSVQAADGDRDGLPNVLIEAMASGRPVISTRENAAPEIITDGENGFLIDRTDAQGLANHLERLLGDDAMGRAMGQKARRTVTDRFDIEKTAAEMVKVFRQSKYS